jgi:tetratricopeptide (TPR) repeat protein
MSYSNDDKIGRRRENANMAINLAMEGRWQEAVNLNQQILESFPQDTDAYNRLGKAYTKLGLYPQAMEAYSKALATDKYNIIAEKNVRRLSMMSEEDMQSAAKAEKGDGLRPQAFIEEIGKSGMVALINPAPAAVLAKIEAGDEVRLSSRDGNLVVESKLNEYLGTVSPTHGRRLLRLLSGGNRYSSTVVGTSENYITVMIREIYQHPSQVGKLSFPAKMLEIDNLSSEAEEEFAINEEIIEAMGQDE